MNSQLNASSYYRANPFYQQGYLPDFAQRNRKPPTHYSQIPQGQQHFDPTNKKHFQKVGYYSTIAQQNIIHNKQQLMSPSRNKQYFRSLNINDIQGATPNTLISKAVKNKQKAQEQMIRKKQQQQYLSQKSQLIKQMKIEDEQKQKQAIQKIKKNNLPNYHEMTKKLRTQQAQNITNIVNSQQNYSKPNSPIYQNQRGQYEQYQPYYQPRKQQYMQYQGKNQASNMEYYKNQLKNKERQIQQLQLQLSKVKENRFVNNQGHNDKLQEQRNYQQNPQQNYQQNYKQNNQQNYQQNYPQNHQRQQYNYSDKQHYNNLQRQRQFQSQKNPQTYQQYQHQPYKHNQYQPSQNDRKSSHNDPSIQRQQQNYYENNSKLNGYQNSNKSVVFKDLQQREQKQFHRKFNPTYLSYGSAIGLAGKNIVGY